MTNHRPLQVDWPFVVSAARLILCFALLAAIVFPGLLALMPPWEKDELIHHLAIPQIWLRAGHFVETPWATFSYYPMNLDLLYLVPLAFGQDLGAHFIHLGFGLLTGILVFVFLRKRLGPTWGLVGALIFLSTPMVIRLGAAAYVDLGLTFFVTAGILALIRWSQTGRRLDLVWSGLALGLALGTKYQGVIAIPILAPMVFVISIRNFRSLAVTSHGYGRAIGTTMLWLGLALVVFSPWPIKNFILTGNPVYPLLNSWFGLPDIVPPDLKIPTIVQRKFFYGESWLDYLLIPLRFFFQGQDHNPRFFDGVLNPLLLILPNLALLRHNGPRGDLNQVSRPKLELAHRKPTSGIELLVGLSVFWILTVAWQGAIARYLAPVLPALAILSTFGLYRFYQFWTHRGRPGIGLGLAAVAITSMLIINAGWAENFWREVDPEKYLTGRENRHEYLTRKLDFYPAMGFINKSLPKNARVLFLFAGDRGYYCQRDYFYRTWFSGELIKEVLARASSLKQALNAIKGLPATHLLVNDNLLTSYFSGLEDTGLLNRWSVFQKEGLLSLFSARGYTVYLVRE